MAKTVKNITLEGEWEIRTDKQGKDYLMSEVYGSLYNRNNNWLGYLREIIKTETEKPSEPSEPSEP